MSRQGVRKFTYDTVFTADGGTALAPEDQRVSFSREELKAARAESFAEGERAATAEAERQAARAVEAVGAQLAGLIAQLDTVCAELRRDAVELGLAGARAAADAALVRCPEEAVTALFAQCMENLRGAPAVIAEAPPHVVDVVRERLTAVARQAGLDGAIDVRAGAGPARLEWSSGAVSIDPEFALAKAREAAERWLAAADRGSAQMNLFADRAAG